MKLRHKLAFCFFTLVILASFTTDALASCPRTQQGPPCQEYWQTDAVFIGVANRVVNVPNNTLHAIGPYARTTAYFTIEEAFKGVGGTGVVFDSTDCGYLFKEGERYLVYAYRNSDKNNELHVRIGHTRTRPLSEAVEDLKYIRGLASEAGSKIFGKVVQHTHNMKHGGYDVELLQNIKVILEGNDQRQEVVTDSEGRYEFRRLPEGTYQIRAEVPAYLSYDRQTIKVTGRGCVPLDIPASRKGRIAGRVVDMNSRPLRNVPVSLVSADASPEEILLSEGKDRMAWTVSWTNNEGRFWFSQLPPGRYLLVINRAEFERSRGSETLRALPRLFYPGVSDVGGATVIVVGKEDEPQEYDFRLPIPQ